MTLNDYIVGNFSVPSPGSVNDKIIALFQHLYTGTGAPTIEALTGSFFFDILNGAIYTTANGIDWTLGSGGGGGASSITPTTIPAAGSTRTLDANGAALSVFDVTLDQATCALTYTGFEADKYSEMLVRLHQPVAGGKAITHATNPLWEGNNEPVIRTDGSSVTSYIVYTLDGTTLEGTHGQQIRTFIVNISGALSAGAVKNRIYFESDTRVLDIRASVGDAPVSTAAVFDVNKNGTTIYTTQANRPSISAGANTTSAATPDVTAYAAGDYLTVDVDTASSAGYATIQIQVLQS